HPLMATSSRTMHHVTKLESFQIVISVFKFSKWSLNFAPPPRPLDKPNISVTPEGSSEIKEGDNLSLRCQAEGNPTPSYQWVVPQAGPTSNTRAEGSVVNVTHIARSQAGNYTCIATNEVGNSTWTVDVKVTGKKDWLAGL
uniref:Ig-like domain-containing protein n=1 Tax=Esox lucius TaxID=8010 RepID=A0AAY5KEU8_ESOLU